ncbi:hypothetical protein GL2_42100 [Microbulbifer sp. GL-2]|nr:hypothetical protein GL2_42100 [Microbulbifer sp. GL-2]
MDFNSGTAVGGNKMHLWDCDGGNSEKLQVLESGIIQNRDKNWKYCIDTPVANADYGEQLQIYQRNNNDTDQKFTLDTVNEWKQTSF